MKKRYKLLVSLFALVVLGFIVPEPRGIPVAGATKSDWNKDSFWYEPWGTSGVHKGVDIFAKKGTPVLAATNMLILYQGEIHKGGKVIVGLAPKWRLHYFAHLEEFERGNGFVVKSGTVIGSVGDTGNAKGKQPHLHFSILSLVPLPWMIDKTSQGYKKAVYIDPITYLAAKD